MNGAVDSSATEQRRVRRVHDRIDIEVRDVAANQLQSQINHVAVYE
jgi:hypothetical protein